MKSLSLSPGFKGKNLALALLSLLCFLIYSNTFEAPWQLDDYPNILSDPAIHFEEITKDSIREIFYSSSNDGKRVYRPIPRLSFAINWLFHQDDVEGYHFVNLFIHLLNTLVLFSFLWTLFETPRLNSRYPNAESRFFIAFLASAFWAVHPIQTQAVTYVVQRMTSLAALFYLLSMLFYLKGRLASSLCRKIILYFFCLSGYVFALGSKENTILLPISLVLIEAIFFSRYSIRRVSPKKFFYVSFAFFFVVVFSLFVLNFSRGSGLAKLMHAYENRPFTLDERLMTQPRVLFFHLYQIFFPNLNHYSFMHDIKVSQSLWDPLTTLPAIFCLFLVGGVAVWRGGRNPLLSFAILFYLLNHLVESSFIPLEMVFEHRNYLPSMFLFLPVSAGILFLIKRHVYHRASIFILPFLMLTLSLATYQRNEVWATDLSLWKDTYEKAPRLARPAHNLAAAIYTHDSQQYALALELNRQALNGIFMRKERRAQTFFNVGVIHHQIGNIEKSMESFRRATTIMPKHEKAIYNLSMLLGKTGNLEPALSNANRLISLYPKNPAYHSLKGRILFELTEFDLAVDSFNDSIGIDARHESALLYLGVLHCMSGDHRKAEFFLSRATSVSPNNLETWLRRIDNRIQWRNVARGVQQGEAVFNRFTMAEIQNAVDSPQIQFGFSHLLNSLLEEIAMRKADGFLRNEK